MKLRFTPRAAAELEETIRYIRKRSPDGARRVRDRIREVLAHVLDRPHAGVLTSSGLRRVPINPYPYLIFYEIIGVDLIVVGIRHSARDPFSMPDA